MLYNRLMEGEQPSERAKAEKRSFRDDLIPHYLPRAVITGMILQVMTNGDGVGASLGMTGIMLAYALDREMRK